MTFSGVFPTPTNYSALFNLKSLSLTNALNSLKSHLSWTKINTIYKTIKIYIYINYCMGVIFQFYKVIESPPSLPPVLVLPMIKPAFQISLSVNS